MADAGAIRAGKVFLELGVEGIEKVQQQLAVFGNAIKAIGGLLALNFAKDKVTGFADSFAGMSKDIVLMSRQLQVSTDEYQEFGKVAKLVGIEQETMNAAINHSRRFLAELADSGQDSNDSLRALGLTIGDRANRSDLDRLQLLAERLRPLHRDQRARIGQQILGRGGIALASPDVNIGAARMEAGGGHYWSREQLETGYQLARATEKFRSSWDAIGTTVGSVLAPGFTTIYRTMTNALKSAREWVALNGDLIKKLAVGGGLLVGISAALLGIAGTVSLVSYTLSGIGTLFGSIFKLVGFILSPVTLIAGALGTMGYFLLRNTELFGKLSTTAGKFKEGLGAVGAAIEAGDLGLAWSVLTASMKSTWYQLNDDLAKTLGFSLIDAFFLVRKAWIEMCAFIKTTWASLWSFGENAGTRIANDILSGIGGWLGISPDVIKTTINQNNRAQRASNDAYINELANIERQRIEARNRLRDDQARVPQDALNAHTQSVLLQNAAIGLREHRRLEREKRLQEMTDGEGGLLIPNIGGGAMGTFSSAAVAGLGGVNPLRRVEEQGREMANLLIKVVDELKTLKQWLGVG